MNSSQRQDQVNKVYRDKVIQDLFKVGMMVLGLKFAAFAIKKLEE